MAAKGLAAGTFTGEPCGGCAASEGFICEISKGSAGTGGFTGEAGGGNTATEGLTWTAGEGSAATGGLSGELVAALKSASTLVGLELVAVPLHGFMLLGRTFKRVLSGSLHFHRSFTTIHLFSTTSCPLYCFAARRSCSTPRAPTCIWLPSAMAFQLAAENHRKQVRMKIT